jgi:hypothetical protein
LISLIYFLLKLKINFLDFRGVEIIGVWIQNKLVVLLTVTYIFVRQY